MFYGLFYFFIDYWHPFSIKTFSPCESRLSGLLSVFDGWSYSSILYIFFVGAGLLLADLAVSHNYEVKVQKVIAPPPPKIPSFLFQPT